jgi:hypothetical protein
MITLIASPARIVNVSPQIVSRWLATESPNNFQLWRRDFIPTANPMEGMSPFVFGLEFTTPFTGNVGDAIACHNATTGAMLLGKVVSMASPATSILTDIPWQAGAVIDYVNDNTLHGGYYFEGQLKVNDIVQALTIIASPDSFGKADLDVSGVLRIQTSIGKSADNTTLLAAETTKGGKFTFAYRGCWYGSAEAYTAEGNTWYYVEGIRSAEQSSNMLEFVACDAYDAPFLNMFTQPVLFVGLPFDLTFLLPERPLVSPEADLTVVIRRYDSTNTLLSTTTTLVRTGQMEGRVCSLNIDPATIEETAAYMTAEILAP